MKFNASKKINIEDGELKIICKAQTTAMQEELLLLLFPAVGGCLPIPLTRWCLKNLVEEIIINGEKYDPLILASEGEDGPQLSDADTLIVMKKIGSVIVNACLIAEDDLKKL